VKKVAFLFDRSNDWIAAYIPSKLYDLNGYKFYEIYEEASAHGFDIVFLLGYTKIIKNETLKLNKKLLVVHESDLPKGRGFSPLQWQVLEGLNNIPICLLEVTSKVDAGNIYDKIILTLDGTELYDEIRYKQATATFELITNFLKKYPNNSSFPQFGKESKYRRRTPIDSLLDVDKTLRDQFQLLRVCNNEGWPAFFELNGVKYTLKIYKSN
jgi:methionyl-tRNA formyltransferase